MRGSPQEGQDLFGEVATSPKEPQLLAEVVFDRPLETPLTYAVPPQWAELVKPGIRVAAPLGKTREDIGFCVSVGFRVPEQTVKSLSKVLDPEAIVDDHLLRLTRWMSDYYLCPWGQVLAGVVPSGARNNRPPRGVIVYEAEDALKDPALKLTPAQQKIREALLNAEKPLPLKEVLARSGTGSGPLESLVKKGWVIRRSVEIQDLNGLPPRENPPELTPDQTQAWDQIRALMDQGGFHPILLRGVTGSGKTEVYLRAIEHCLSRGQQALVLVPEISLTPQTVSRFRARCGETAVLHSNLSPAERGRYWRKVAHGEAGVAVGARSAIFAPARKLGLIIVDEEHESSFKQENTPRYHARDVAVMRGRMLGIPVILGSATPSLESWNNSQKGAYRLVELPRRVLNLPMPKVDLIDLRYQPPSKGELRVLTEPFLHSIHEALKAKGQVLLLLNRRGWAPQVLCPKCGKVVHCHFCDVPMTYHRGDNRLRCHHCSFAALYEVPCTGCGADTYIFRGFGTERICEELGLRFPGKVIRRMDSDTVRKPGSHELIQEAFRSGLVDILVGTQMIAKGLDFPNVRLVGVIQADIGLQQPDFRASERTFQLLAQVAGRAGRKESSGRVLVQTYQPEHPAIVLASRHDFLTFAREELEHRKLLGYPPFQRMARIIVKGIREDEVVEFSERLGRMARNAMGGDQSPGLLTPAEEQVRVLGPSPAPVVRIDNQFRYHLQFQSPNTQALHKLLRRLQLIKPPSGRVEMAIDIDPQSIL